MSTKASNVNIGDKYNRWEVVSEVFYKAFPNGSKAKFVDCLCSCGTEATVRLASLTSPSKPSISCGCFQREMTVLKNTETMEIGTIFGRLKITGNLGMVEGRNKVTVVCDCGSESFSVRLDQLKYGMTQSCGCLQKEAASKVCTTHGMSKTSAYGSWQKLRYRCDSPKDPRWERYGGRGISYPDHWNTFENFWADMSEGWYEGADIDRIDFDLNYSKENCRWVNRDIGNHNKSKSIGTSTYKGVYFDKSRSKWMARLSRNGVIHLQKRYSSEYEAALAYDNISEEIYGDRPNKTVKGEIP